MPVQKAERPATICSKREANFIPEKVRSNTQFGLKNQEVNVELNASFENITGIRSILLLGIHFTIIVGDLNLGTARPEQDNLKWCHFHVKCASVWLIPREALYKYRCTTHCYTIQMDMKTMKVVTRQ